MTTVIYGATKEREVLPRVLYEILPYRLTEEIRSVGALGVEEIRLRSGRAASLTLPDGNRILKTVLTSLEIDGVMQRLCNGSLYAHSETITQGYVTLAGGIRVGVCGRAATEDGKIFGVYASFFVIII